MRPLAKTLILAGLAALIAAGVRYGVTSARATETEQALADLSSRLDGLEPIVAAVEEFRQGRETIEVKKAVIRELRNQPAVPWGILEPLLEAPPPGVMVERMSARDSALEVSGKAESLDRVGRWLQELQSRDGLEGLDLEGFEVPRRGKRKWGEFTLTGALPLRAERPGPPEPEP